MTPAVKWLDSWMARYFDNRGIERTAENERIFLAGFCLMFIATTAPKRISFPDIDASDEVLMDWLDDLHDHLMEYALKIAETRGIQ